MLLEKQGVSELESCEGVEEVVVPEVVGEGSLTVLGKEVSQVVFAKERRQQWLEGSIKMVEC